MCTHAFVAGVDIRPDSVPEALLQRPISQSVFSSRKHLGGGQLKPDSRDWIMADLDSLPLMIECG